MNNFDNPVVVGSLVQSSRHPWGALVRQCLHSFRTLNSNISAAWSRYVLRTVAKDEHYFSKEFLADYCCGFPCSLPNVPSRPIESRYVTSTGDLQEAMAGCDLELYLSPRQLCDTELICNGGFSPLTGFMTEEEYTSVVLNNRLPNGLLFGLPVVYDTDREDLKAGEFTGGGARSDAQGGAVLLLPSPGLFVSRSACNAFGFLACYTLFVLAAANFFFLWSSGVDVVSLRVRGSPPARCVE